MTQAEQPDIGEQTAGPVSVPPLARTTLDRAALRRRDPQWLAEAWQRALVLVLDVEAGGRALVQEHPDGSVRLVLLESAKAPDGERLFLGVDPDGTPLYAVDAELPALEGTRPAILRDVGGPACKILFDMYHMQRNEGRLIDHMDLAWDEIAYFQIGDVPGRKEPGTGETNYQNVFRHIHQKAQQAGREFVLGMEHGNSLPGKEGDQRVIDAYVRADSFES